MALSNSQYDSIIRMYNKKQLNAQQDNQARINHILSTIPQYQEINNKIADYALSATKELLSGNKSNADIINSKIDALSLMKEDLLISNGYPADYLSTKYECSDCQDTGYIGQEKCHCFKKAIISILYSQSNIDSLLEKENFNTLSYEYYSGEDLERFDKAVKASHFFVDNFDKDYQNILFCGTVGTGKSFLSGCIAKELLDQGHSVIYFSAIELFEVLSDVMFNRTLNADLRSLKSDLYECDLLIIDDLGTELTNSAVATQIFSLLNERHLLKKSTIISTNLSLEDLKGRYEDRIFSRIAERYSIYRISGPDIRRLRRNAK